MTNTSPALYFFHRLEAGLFAVEAKRRAGEFQIRHAGDFHNCAIGREIAFQAHDSTGDGDRIVGLAHHVLVRVPFHRLEILRDGAAGDRHAVAMQEPVIEQCLHQERHTASFEPILGDIVTARL